MRPPTLRGLIERRLLVNYRTDPERAAALLPPPLRPQIVHGWAVGGICLIRLSQLRPVGVPTLLGHASENAAHRIAVEWDTPDGTAVGVYVPRRDTSSAVNAMIGGRLLSGEHHRARFAVAESADHLQVSVTSVDNAARVDVQARPATELTGSALFPRIEDAAAFFRAGVAGYSTARGGKALEGLELHLRQWSIEPLQLVTASSSLFDDRALFPAGAATLDSALLMRSVPATWNPAPPLRIGT